MKRKISIKRLQKYVSVDRDKAWPVVCLDDVDVKLILDQIMTFRHFSTQYENCFYLCNTKHKSPQWIEWINVRLPMLEYPAAAAYLWKFCYQDNTKWLICSIYHYLLQGYVAGFIEEAVFAPQKCLSKAVLNNGQHKQHDPPWRVHAKQRRREGQLIFLLIINQG